MPRWEVRIMVHMETLQGPYLPPEVFLWHYPEELDLLYWGGRGSRYHVLALDFEAMALEDVLTQKIKGGASRGVPFHGWQFLLLSYEDLRRERWRESLGYEVHACLVFDTQRQEIFFVSQKKPERWRLKEIWPEPQKNAWGQSAPALSLVSESTPELYLSQVEQVLRDIREGHYYQINLLRYFGLMEQPSFRDLKLRFLAKSSSMSSWLRVAHQEVLSFSPERMIRVSGEEELHIIAQPIKGTIGLGRDLVATRELAQKLLCSQKDRSELNMIIDLLRNDLFRVCEPHSVAVLESASLRSLETLQHLQAHIKGVLRKDLTYEQLFRALLPGGSITGAPKIEVMKQIATYEQRSRGFFMGNAVVKDAVTGALDSSILIRTLVRKNQPFYQYAAGSGLVVDSSPEGELAEIATKCRVLTDPVNLVEF